MTGDLVINTHTDSVTYSGPVDRDDPRNARRRNPGYGLFGAWVGEAPVLWCRVPPTNTITTQEIPFVARWAQAKPSQLPGLLQSRRWLGALIAAVKPRQTSSGAANPNRFAELNGDLLIGVPALLEGATYLSINRRGLRGKGTFSATYLPPVAPLTAAEVTAIGNELAAADGDPDFVQPGITANAPVPTLPTNDAPTCRDIARALEQVIAQLQQRTQFRTRIATGTSSGARLFAALNFGRSVIGTKSVRTGGNYLVPYDATSPRIFDGFILMGFGYTAGIDHAVSVVPLSAPVMFFQGQGEERLPATRHHAAHNLLKKGVVLDGRIWIYEIKNLTHVTRDNAYDITTGSDGDCLGCFLSPARHPPAAPGWRRDGRPRSCRMAGRIINGMLQFDQAGGTISNVAPIPNDPTRDTSVFDANLTPRPIGSDENGPLARGHGRSAARARSDHPPHCGLPARQLQADVFRLSTRAARAGGTGGELWLVRVLPCLRLPDGGLPAGPKSLRPAGRVGQRNSGTRTGSFRRAAPWTGAKRSTKNTDEKAVNPEAHEKQRPVRSLLPSKPLTGQASPRRSVCAPTEMTISSYRRPPNSAPLTGGVLNECRVIHHRSRLILAATFFGSRLHRSRPACSAASSSRRGPPVLRMASSGTTRCTAGEGRGRPRL